MLLRTATSANDKWVRNKHFANKLLDVVPLLYDKE
jgi:hypothetical protein